MQDLVPESFRAYKDVLARGEVFNVASLSDLPPDWERDRERFAEQGIASLLCVPLSCRGKIRGFVGVDAVRKERKWSTETVSLLRLGGEMLIGMIDRTKTRGALSESEEKHRSIFENASEGIVVVRGDRILLANPRALEFAGVAMEEFLSKPFIEFIHQNDREGIIAYQKAIIEGDTVPPPFVLRPLRPDGAEMWTEVRGVNILWDGEQAQIALLTDVTETRKAERLVRSNYHFLETLLDTISIPVFYKDMGGVYLGCNRAFAEEVLGCPREEVVGKTIYDFAYVVPPEKAEAYRKADQALIKNGGTQEYEIELVRVSGERSLYYISKAIYPDSEGKPAGIVAVMLDITARKRAENALRESEDRFRTLVENAPDGILLFDAERRRFVDANDRVQSILGYSKEELHGKSWENISAPIQIDGLPTLEYGKKLENAVLEGETTTNEWIFRHADDSEVTVELRLTRMTTNNQNLIRASLLDISDRKRAEKALRDSDLLVQALMRASDDPLIIEDMEGTILEINEAAASLIGMSKEEAVGQNSFDNMPPEMAEVRRGFARKIREQGKEVRFEDDWGDKWFDNVVYPVQDEKGELTRLAILTRDITDRKKAEAERNRLATAIEQAGEGIVITDTKGTIEYVNPAFERMTGYTARDAVGESPRIQKSGRHDEAFYRDMWNTITRGEVWKGRLYNKRKDDSVYAEEMTISPIRNASGETVGYVALKRNISEMIQLETRVRQKQKMEAIGTLAGGIAHDFNNIIYAILGFNDLALDQVSTENEARPCLEQVREAGWRATDLVSQILAFSRQQEPERKAHRLQPIAREALGLLESARPLAIQIRQSIDDECGPVQIDATEVHQIVMNLCTNAFHAMRKEGGTLEFTLQERTLDDTTAIDGPDLPAGRYAVFVVGDTGEGMDESTASRVFEPYFTTKDIGEGTGMGLSTVHGLVDSLGGTIVVESAVGRGTRFEVFLPIAGKRGETPEARRAGRGLPGGTESILLLEDEDTIRELMSTILESLGYRVEAIANGAYGLRLFRLDPERFDLVITDQSMPGILGTELARSLLAMRADLPVILCSGKSGPVPEEKAKSVGIRKVLRKPIEKDLLARSIREVLDQVSQVGR